MDTACAVIAKIIDAHRCPITHQLLVDPVTAEDGHVYERDALKQWLTGQDRSPVTNRVMSSAVYPTIAARQTVSGLADAGLLDDDTLLHLLTARGRARATRTEAPGPDLDGALADLQRARSLSKTAAGRDDVDVYLQTVEWMRAGVKLFTQAKAHEGDEFKRWLGEVGCVVGSAVSSRLMRRMTEWIPLAEGTRVRVIDDAAELTRLCERPPPGAKEKVRWNEDMSSFLGQVCIIRKVGEKTHMNYVLHRESSPSGRAFSFPYDSLILMA